MELPPRARRILALGIESLNAHGTTSACAENTNSTLPRPKCFGNYLRVRGEYRLCMRIPPRLMELPPRARRIQLGNQHNGHIQGTTSACAENTEFLFRHFRLGWNYLRVRGEYVPRSAECIPGLELPPRARRIREAAETPVGHVGTTSACAENTCWNGCSILRRWNYLRVRGEYPK